MKKLLGATLFILILSMTLVGCGTTTAPQELNELSKAEVLATVEEYCEIDYLTQDIICDSEGVTDARVLAVINAFDDTSQYPSYMFDEHNEYVTIDDLGALLKVKYFETTFVDERDDYYKKSGETVFKIVMQQGFYTQDDMFAKAVLMLNELENYDYYYLSSSDVVIEVYWLEPTGYGRGFEIRTSKDNLLSDTLLITPEGFFTNYLEMEYDTMDVEIDETLVNTWYNEYKDDYIGYVLNYQEE